MRKLTLIVFAFSVGCQGGDPPAQTGAVHQPKAEEPVGEYVPILPTVPIEEDEAVLPVIEEGVEVTVDAIKARGPRIFCSPDMIASGAHGELTSIPGSERKIVLVGTDEPCVLRLAVRDETGRLTDITARAGSFYSASAVEMDDGRVAIVFNTVNPGEWRATGDGRLTTDRLDPRVEVVFMLRDGTFTSPQIVVEDPDAAVWLAGTEGGKELKIKFLRDSLYEHMLMVHEGRPKEDGLFQMTVSTATATLTPTGVKRLGDYGFDGASGLPEPTP